MKVIIIGGGPAGIMAAISASQEKNQVLLIEKNETLGKKLLITGKGRCNLTSSLDISEFINNIPGNGKFLYSAFNSFNNQDIIKLLEEKGLKTKVERGNRIFPVTDSASSVLEALLKRLKELKVEIRTDTKVSKILEEKGRIVGVVANGEKIKADKIILATGGKSYPITGSTGEGYNLAKELGHTIIKPVGSIVPLTSKDKKCKELQGLSLKNVKIQFKDIENNKLIYEDFGEMLFTHFGVSGPTILSGSAHLIRYKNIEEKLLNGRIKLFIDLKPALLEEELDKRVLRDFEKYKNKEFKNSLNDLLPQKMIPTVIELSGIDEQKKVNEINKVERRKIVELLKKFEIEINGFRPIEEAIITAGGINIKEIDPKTMESKLIKNLYFAGEIIDVDAYTGGFNLQIAYSTGYLAGKN